MWSTMSYKIQQAKSLSNTTNLYKSLGSRLLIQPYTTRVGTSTLYNNAAPQKRLGVECLFHTDNNILQLGGVPYFPPWGWESIILRTNGERKLNEGGKENNHDSSELLSIM